MSEIREQLIRKAERLQKEFDENREEHARLMKAKANAWSFKKGRTRELAENRRQFAKLYSALRSIKLDLQQWEQRYHQNE